MVKMIWRSIHHRRHSLNSYICRALVYDVHIAVDYVTVTELADASATHTFTENLGEEALGTKVRHSSLSRVEGLV